MKLSMKPETQRLDTLNYCFLIQFPLHQTQTNKLSLAKYTFNRFFKICNSYEAFLS